MDTLFLKENRMFNNVDNVVMMMNYKEHENENKERNVHVKYDPFEHYYWPSKLMNYEQSPIRKFLQLDNDRFYMDFSSNERKIFSFFHQFNVINEIFNHTGKRYKYYMDNRAVIEEDDCIGDRLKKCKVVEVENLINVLFNLLHDKATRNDEELVMIREEAERRDFFFYCFKKWIDLDGVQIGATTTINKMLGGRGRKSKKLTARWKICFIEAHQLEGFHPFPKKKILIMTKCT